MKKLLMVVLTMVLAGCGAAAVPTPVPTATPNPGEIALQMVQQQMAAEATQQIVALQFTATAQVLGATSTVAAQGTQEAVTAQARLDVQATAEQVRRDAQATQQRIDAEATQFQARIDMEATAEQARLELKATQQAQATSTAFSMTQMVIPTHNLWTQQAVEGDMALATNEVELSNLAVEQQRQTNTLDWAVPMGIAILLALGLVLYAYSYSRVREIKDADGNVTVFVYDNKQVVATNLLPKPVLMLETGVMPDMTNPQEQSEIVRRDQGVRMMAAMPVTPANHAVTAFNSFMGDENKRAPYEIVESGAVPAELLDGEAVRAMEQDWKANNEQ